MSRDIGRQSHSIDVRNDRLDHALQDYADEEDMLKTAGLDDNTSKVPAGRAYGGSAPLHPSSSSTDADWNGPGKDRASPQRDSLDDGESDEKEKSTGPDGTRTSWSRDDRLNTTSHVPGTVNQAGRPSRPEASGQSTAEKAGVILVSKIDSRHCVPN
jgi:hypothetical protein